MNSRVLKKLMVGAAPLALGAMMSGTSAFAQPAASDDAPHEVIVTGSRIAQPELTSSSPLSVVSSDDIKLQGTTRVEDVLNTLPSIFASQASTLSNGSDGTASVDLRGLGTSRTLSLVNGRRLLPGDPSPGSGSAADINIIPATLLKRVEVLTGGASSVYGADAVAGVVNFIIDTDFTGFKIDGQYSFYQHNNNDTFLRGPLEARGFDFPTGGVSDGGAVDATAVFGTKFGEDDRGHAVTYFGYRKINASRKTSAITAPAFCRTPAAARRVAAAQRHRPTATSFFLTLRSRRGRRPLTRSRRAAVSKTQSRSSTLLRSIIISGRTSAIRVGSSRITKSITHSNPMPNSSSRTTVRSRKSRRQVILATR